MEKGLETKRGPEKVTTREKPLSPEDLADRLSRSQEGVVKVVEKAKTPTQKEVVRDVVKLHTLPKAVQREMVGRLADPDLDTAVDLRIRDEIVSPLSDLKADVESGDPKRPSKSISPITSYTDLSVAGKREISTDGFIVDSYKGGGSVSYRLFRGNKIKVVGQFNEKTIRGELSQNMGPVDAMLVVNHIQDKGTKMGAALSSDVLKTEFEADTEGESFMSKTSTQMGKVGADVSVFRGAKDAPTGGEGNLKIGVASAGVSSVDGEKFEGRVKVAGSVGAVNVSRDTENASKLGLEKNLSEGTSAEFVYSKDKDGRASVEGGYKHANGNVRFKASNIGEEAGRAVSVLATHKAKITDRFVIGAGGELVVPRDESSRLDDIIGTAQMDLEVKVAHGTLAATAAYDPVSGDRRIQLNFSMPL